MKDLLCKALQSLVRYAAPKVGLTVITFSKDSADEEWLAEEHDAHPGYATGWLH